MVSSGYGMENKMRKASAISSLRHPLRLRGCVSAKEPHLRRMCRLQSPTQSRQISWFTHRQLYIPLILPKHISWHPLILLGHIKNFKAIYSLRTKHSTIFLKTELQITRFPVFNRSLGFRLPHCVQNAGNPSLIYQRVMKISCLNFPMMYPLATER